MTPSERAREIERLQRKIKGCEQRTKNWKADLERLEGEGPLLAIRRLSTVVAGALAVVTADVDPSLLGHNRFRWTIDDRFHAVTDSPETIIPTTNLRPGQYIVAVEPVPPGYAEQQDRPLDRDEPDCPPDEPDSTSTATAASTATEAYGSEREHEERTDSMIDQAHPAEAEYKARRSTRQRRSTRRTRSRRLKRGTRPRRIA